MKKQIKSKTTVKISSIFNPDTQIGIGVSSYGINIDKDKVTGMYDVYIYESNSSKTIILDSNKKGFKSKYVSTHSAGVTIPETKYGVVATDTYVRKSTNDELIIQNEICDGIVEPPTIILTRCIDDPDMKNHYIASESDNGSAYINLEGPFMRQDTIFEN